MKFLIVGLGSMGKRRIRNLKQLDQTEIIGFDLNVERCNEAREKYGISIFTNIEDALDKNPNAMIVSTPPDLHMKYAKVALENNIHFFTEASVTNDGMDEIINKLKTSKVIGMPSCTMRYHPMVMKLNEIIQSNELGRVLAFTHHSGQYLPDWHPWEDYRDFYVSKRNTGACREIVPFELVWIIDTFGEIKNVIGDITKVSSLDVDIDDIYNIILEFQNKIRGILTVDVIARNPIRHLKVMLENGTIEADWYKKIIKWSTPKNGWNESDVSDGTAEKGYIHGERMYENEMIDFIEYIEGKKSISYTFEDDKKVLRILEAIEKSNDNGTRETINN